MRRPTFHQNRMRGSSGMAGLLSDSGEVGRAAPGWAHKCTLVGLEIRPRKMREAAALWERLTEAGGIGARDAVWAHPDLMPSAADLDEPDRQVIAASAPVPGELLVAST
jgi:hypothetical protein